MLSKVEVSLQPVVGRTMFGELLWTAAGGQVDSVEFELGAEGAIVLAGAEPAVVTGSILILLSQVDWATGTPTPAAIAVGVLETRLE